MGLVSALKASSRANISMRDALSVMPQLETPDGHKLPLYKLKKIVIPTLIRSFLYPRSKHEKGTNSKNGYFIDFLFLFQGTNCIKSYILYHFLQGTNFSQRSRAWISFFNFQIYVLNSITSTCLNVGRKDINTL